MKIVFAGNSLRAIECLKFLLKKKVNIVLSVGHPRNKTDNKNFLSIENISKKKNLKFISPKTLNTYKFYKKLKQIKPDLMILVGYSACILKKKIYEVPKYGTINLHASLLPKYRGGSPLNWVIINNEKFTGISILQVDEGIDTGNILSQRKIKINKKETILTLTKKVNLLYPRLLFKTLKEIFERKQFKIYKSKKLKYFKKRKPEDGYLDFNELSAIKIERMVRALLPPFPGAFFFYKRKKIIIIKMHILKKKTKHKPGSIINVGKNSLIISTIDYPIKITKFLILNTKKLKLTNFKAKDMLNENI